MKSLRFTITVLATAAIALTASAAPSVLAQDTMPATGTPATATPAQANQTSTFGAQETDQSPYILSTNPTSKLGGTQRYGLMILEKKQDRVPCFDTVGSRPTTVLPLLAQLPDFSGLCGRSTDTNGYLIRTNGTDVKYDPVLEEQNGVLVLYAKPQPFAPRGSQPFVIGKTDGISPSGYTKIFLNPGWRLARQTFNNSVTGRTYLANDMTVAQLVQQSGGEVVVTPPTNPTTPTQPPVVTPPAPSAGFPDVQGNLYTSQINRAVQLGFISGFAEDNTFRPKAPLTREQLVSMVIDGLEIPNRPQVTSNPYPDVPISRWSAPKIKLAQELGLVSGYRDGTFKPTQSVTRAELIAVMRRAAEYKTGVTQLVSNQTARTFSDTQGNWAQGVISSLSGYCGIATPLNETGSAFYPNQAAQRDYAAAAMVRLLDCPQTTAGQ
ncbi:MAG: DUF3747 domain-containing protein [Phormidesmis sp.]